MSRLSLTLLGSFLATRDGQSIQPRGRMSTDGRETPQQSAVKVLAKLEEPGYVPSTQTA